MGRSCTKRIECRVCLKPVNKSSVSHKSTKATKQCSLKTCTVKTMKKFGMWPSSSLQTDRLSVWASSMTMQLRSSSRSTQTCPQKRLQTKSLTLSDRFKTAIRLTSQLDKNSKKVAVSSAKSATKWSIRMTERPQG